MKYGEYAELLRRMVRVPSPSFEEEGVCKVISSALDGMGIAHKVVYGNILALNRRFDPSLKTLALDAHMDTVPPAGSYTRDPYDPGDDPDIIWGLGSNDDGGSVVSMIAAFRHFYDEPLPFNLMLILSREEEKSGPDGTALLFGSDGYFASAEEFPMPDWVIVGEPTGMRAATSERGLLVLDGVASGVSGHAARDEGVNALYIALEDIEKLRSHRFTRHSDTMGDVRLSVTQIEAGVAHNVIPDSCRFVVDIRPTDRYTNEEILAELQALCRSTLTPRNLRNRSSSTPAGSRLLETVERLGWETFSSPTTSDWIRIGCEAIKMGPGDSARSHHADEYLKVSEMVEAIDKFIIFIRSFYGDTLE
ncbi:MAG: M20/M25/M40 family metallo-hydrolase [Bacteroidales bacterium]|nr:M20/M25/M40 family metallo-hydrolase [Bacteroidales bacterium]